MYREIVEHNNPNLNINISSNRSNKRTVYTQMHFHTCLEFLYILQGSYLCHTDKDNILVQAGEIIFFNSRTPHATETTTDSTVECVMLQFDDLVKTPENAKFLSRFIEQNNVPYYVFKAKDKNTNTLIDLIMTIYNEREKKDIAHNYIITAKKLEIFALLHRAGLLTENTPNALHEKSIQHILPIAEFIEKHYITAVSLQDIGSALHMNKNYICKIFKAATSKTIMDYLNFVRVENARPLLKAGLSVSQVASSVGFASQSYFNKIFQKYILCTPSEYKKRFLENL